MLVEEVHEVDGPLPKLYDGYSTELSAVTGRLLLQLKEQGGMLGRYSFGLDTHELSVTMGRFANACAILNLLALFGVYFFGPTPKQIRKDKSITPTPPPGAPPLQ